MRLISRHRWLGGAVAAMLAGLTLYGCKDFLNSNASPQGTLDEGTLRTLAGVEGTLIATYRQLDCTTSSGAWGCAVSNWAFASATSDDAYKGSEATDQPPVDQLEEFHWSTPDAQGYINDKWRAMYEGVVRANSTLRLLEQVQAASPGAIPAEDAAGIKGEALFLRAHYHFEAWRMWGNVPYYRETDEDFRKANETKAQVAADLIKDLDEAIPLLPTTPRHGEVGRATKWTAKAYKGRVQMYAGDFAGALTTLREIQASGPYALETSYDKVWTGFKDLENGKETIFAYQASVNDGQPDGQNSNFGERLNFPHSGSPFGCCGFHQPSQNLVNFFRVDAVGLPLALTSATWNVNNANFTAADNTVPVDPRLDWTVGRDGVPFKDWGPHEPGWIRAPAYGGNYSAKKNAHEKSSGAQSTVGWTNTQLNSVNIHIFRYADLLLMLAEAEAEAGSPENARAIVNQIRARAAQKAQGPGTDRATIAVPLNDPSITWATYKVGQYLTPWDQATARTAVRYERRLELAMEGQRFFDLRRWGIADQVLNAYLNGVGGGSEKARRAQLTSAETFVQRHYLYPIPDLQIQLSTVGGTSTLTQNPGW
ncbi:MAG TPA: RagB/SusD family nutrient uptake outer membrane protein [Gemmatimonadaceae bacterium]|nr:RagB/SusD family nutrient uptake outer membrane protein [Gemmatimonadaceae bacterium]